MAIAQNAKKVVFCGTFDTKGSKLEVGGGKLTIAQHGHVRKLVGKVEQITYSGRQALKRGHKAVFVTERAVFHLAEEGLVLSEIAPGVDIRRDIRGRMDFAPLIPRDPKLMDSAIYTD